MRIYQLFFLFFFFLYSCSQIEFVLLEGESENPLKEKTNLIVTNSSSPIFKEQLVSFFGENIEKKFDLIINASEKKTNRFVEKSQAASKIDYEITINYWLINRQDNCTILKKYEKSQFSFTPKSSGYNFGSDRSLNGLYKNVFKNNIKSFLSDARENIKTSGCLIEK